MGHVYSTYRDPKSMPDIVKGPMFDQLQGFPNGRKKRVSVVGYPFFSSRLHFFAQVTEEEMIAAGLKPHERDYCAHTLIAFRKCRAENFFSVITCAKLKHINLHCHESDRLLRRKEYERERRLLAKQNETQPKFVGIGDGIMTRKHG
ncbi:NADH-ubiquinone oxidoreductase B18 subunit [Opisthorchis viverrini]|uniref:NADH dehydrogenase [ubiquinone] 1 beta subcomplex subunit 7 n=1 Tax=Opisthorchis viverrini TaxID=6198 RepID=A0A1S8WJI8_OPIVI|nr:NADH-ubiquinone oxidoreductase B18 subunit [Opisthorchis viverrini]